MQRTPSLPTRLRAKSLFRRRLPAALACLIVAAGIAGCSTSPESSSDPETRIRVGAAKEFALQLESNVTTGFAWQLAQPLDTAVVALLGTSYQQTGSSLLGAGGVEVWRFRAVGRGQTTIALEYRQPWATGEPPQRIAHYTVVVE